jgi:hypothetical protein
MDMWAVSDRLREINDEMFRLEGEGRWTKEEFLRLCSKAREVSGNRRDCCSTLLRHALPEWRRDEPRS